MKLTRLELSGFKSFADHIELPFEDGITCIVGPNGCGKSNVSDAVRWVLGEQRARMLRGAKMDDVIFQGSIKRKPLNLANVSLFFDNEDGTLPITYQEVALTRQLSRNGQSDYLVNKSPTRLKDVQDLLRGTGLGSDAGVVIEAKMIDRLLSDKAEERRSLFEEAAGIGLYRDRKIITERRLGKTLDDLQRLDDLISEVQTQVRGLARQRGKAERHQKFTQERFHLVMELARRALDAFTADTDAIDQERNRIAVVGPRSHQALSSKERERETTIQQRASAVAQRTEVERRLADRRLEVERLEGDLKLAVERLEHARGRKERAREEREIAGTAASHARLELDAATAEWEAAKTQRDEVQIELDLRTANEGETRSRLTGQRDRVRDLEDALQKESERLRALEGERTALDAELVDLEQQITLGERRLADATQAIGQARERHEGGALALDQAEATDREASSSLDGARHELTAAREHDAAVTIDRRNAEDSVTQLGARREALEALERDRAGLAPAARQLLGARDQFSPGAVHGPLVDFISATTAGAQIAERFLSDWLHAVVVRDDSAITEIQAWHRNAKPGPLLLLPINPGPTGVIPNGAGDLAITAAEPARAWAEALLAGHTALDVVGTAVRRPNGAVLLSGSDEAIGPLERRAELEALSERLETARARLVTLEDAARDVARRTATAEGTLATATKTADEARQALLEARGTAEAANREMQRAERESTDARENRDRLAERRTGRTTRHEEVTTQLRASESSRTGLDAELNRQRALLGNMENEQETAREKRVHWQVEEAQVSARENAARERKERAGAALEQASSDIARLENEVQGIDDSTSGLTSQQTDWTDRLAERRTEVTELGSAAIDAEQNVLRTEAGVTQLETELETLREQVAQVGEQTHQLELRETELRGQKQALIERLQAEWHRSLEELLDAAPDRLEGETAELEAEANRLRDAIEAMGPVNPLAAQEHAEERERAEFLSTQRDDLTEARSSLEQSLKEIDQTARRLFQEAFDAIRENFGRVFQTLFEGGECDLGLADPYAPLESEIEIRAAPRGKRTQRIHLLSSGERALVALSLLFAIYLAKPSPFCLLDEVDAPLDDANVQRFIRLLTEFKNDTQFIVITHNPRTMQVADAVYGVTMQEPGVSTIVGVRLGAHATA